MARPRRRKPATALSSRRIFTAFIFLLTLGYYFNNFWDETITGPLFQDVVTLHAPLHDDGMRYVVFAGTRPEIIKTAPVVQELRSAAGPSHVVYVFTGQHPDMAQPFIRFWDVNFDLVLSKSFSRDNTSGSLTGKLIAEIEMAIPKRPNDVWIVQGDTSTVFAAATVAFLRQTPIVHLEAGLRTYDMSAPFPEEFHRQTVSLAASLHIPPTDKSMNRLLSEGIERDRVFNLGNSVIDAVRLAEPKWSDADAPKAVRELKNRIALVTLHRRENADDFSNVYDTLGNSACPDVTFVTTVHPNPPAGNAARTACAKHGNIVCVDPLDYAATQWMLKRSFLLVTDSGGLQEEATWYSTPTLVARTHTERTEAIEAGVSSLVPPKNPALLGSLLSDLCGTNSERLSRMSSSKSFPFGDGYTSSKLVALLQKRTTIDLLQRPIVLKPNQNQAAELPEASVAALLPGCNQTTWWVECDPIQPTVDVVLTVYKRSTLLAQLAAVKKQTMKPNHLWIVVNGEESQQLYNMTTIIDNWREKNPSIPADVISSTFNTKFHGRFHLGYALSDATYISIWDNDVLPAPGWLDFCVKFSASHNGGLVGGNGRRISMLMVSIHQRKAEHKGSLEFYNAEKKTKFDRDGLVDFVGHVWTLRREYLRHYLGSPVLTHQTGEDIQLSMALQRHGIGSYYPEHLFGGDVNIDNLDGANRDEHATWIVNPKQPREWLFCKAIEQGFQTISCANCNKKSVVNRCLHYFEYKDHEVLPQK